MSYIVELEDNGELWIGRIWKEIGPGCHSFGRTEEHDKKLVRAQNF